MEMGLEFRVGTLLLEPLYQPHLELVIFQIGSPELFAQAGFQDLLITAS
jgi:hypothetical protein